MADWEQKDARHLVDRIQRGIDRERHFGELFRRFHGSLRGTFVRKGFSPGDAEDLTQDVFLRVFRGIDNFRGEARFERWLFEIADHVFSNELRRRSAEKRDARETSLDGLEREPVPVVVPGGLGRAPAEPLADLLATERLQAVARSITGLPQQMRTCVELRYQKSLKYREIAEQMGITIDTVKAHLHQAKKRLQLELGEEPEE
jgi:RNA polymerase sigma-70 factor (ECF subfamily)